MAPWPKAAAVPLGLRAATLSPAVPGSVRAHQRMRRDPRTPSPPLPALGNPPVAGILPEPPRDFVPPRPPHWPCTPRMDVPLAGGPSDGLRLVGGGRSRPGERRAGALSLPRRHEREVDDGQVGGERKRGWGGPQA
uniref:Predicted protein n=1 Tax=Hordeum vulgare subsp. vulgare TaxID=112509 RepID=F2CTI5_HORVV|nr:predicted protein [Hordeum vulgare subsp. vulgare]